MSPTGKLSGTSHRSAAAAAPYSAAAGIAACSLPGSGGRGERRARCQRRAEISLAGSSCVLLRGVTGCALPAPSWDLLCWQGSRECQSSAHHGNHELMPFGINSSSTSSSTSAFSRERGNDLVFKWILLSLGNKRCEPEDKRLNLDLIGADRHSSSLELYSPCCPSGALPVHAGELPCSCRLLQEKRDCLEPEVSLGAAWGSLKCRGMEGRAPFPRFLVPWVEEGRQQPGDISLGDRRA